MLSHRSPLFVRRAVVWHGSALCACFAAVVLGGCSAPLDGEDEDSDGPPEFSGQVPGVGAPGAPAGNTTPAPADMGSTPSAGTPSAGNEQNSASGAPIAPSNPANTGSNSGTNPGTSNSGAGGAGMVGGDSSNAGAGGSAMGSAGTTGMPTTPPPVTTPPVTPPPATGSDTTCPANASFCSGFEGAGFPAGSQFEPSYLAADALGAQVQLDATVAHGGRQSLHMPVGANYYRMLSVAVPGNDFWIRLYTRSDVGFGAQGSTHATLFMGSIVAPGGDYNADRAVEIAEQFGQVLLNVKDSLFGTSGTNPNGQPGTRLPDDTWTCMEAHFDGNTGDIGVFVDGSEIIDAAGWQAPMTFRSFRFGYLRFDSPARDVWMDDVVVAPARVGCQ